MNVIDRIIPVPQQLELQKAAPADLTKGYRIVAENITGTLAQKAIVRLVEQLETRLGIGSGEEGVLIHMTMDAAPEDMPNPDQGYKIRVQEKAVELTGFGEAGLYYAVTTLLQALENGMLPAMTLLDWPALKTRGHFLETRYGTDMMELEDWQEVVDFMVDHKENQLTVSVYGCWQVQFDDRVSEYVFVPFEGYPELETPVIQKYFSPRENKWVEKTTKTPMFEKDFLGKLMAYGKERGVQVIPMMNSFGHNTLIPRMYPEVSALDEEGKPSFTGYCTANPKTYELIFDLYDQIIDRYCVPNGIEAFDIGLDEVRDGKAYLPGDVGNNRSPWCKCPQCRDKTHGQLVIEHAVKLMSHLKEKGMKTVYMYNDMVVDYVSNNAAGTLEDRTDQFHAALKEKDLLDVACLDWWAYREKREMFKFTTIHPELGLRSTMKPWNGYYNWAFLVNAVHNNYHISKIANDEKAEGMRSYSTWDGSYHRNCQLQADYAWNHAGTGVPSAATARYVRRYFPNAQGQANAAFLLMEDIGRWRDKKNINTAESSRYEVLYSHLCFYEYTYYRAGKEYPRNFPGEMVPRLRTDCSYVQELQLMRALSDQASALWQQVAESPDCDQTLALRYQYEAENYGMLCRDFLTVAQLDELAQSWNESRDPALLQEIAKLAAAQKQARLSHLAKLEQTKESYLMPGNGRVQCAPMQYFADIEAYLTTTPTEDLKLDFTDMRHAASDRFKSLR